MSVIWMRCFPNIDTWFKFDSIFIENICFHTHWIATSKQSISRRKCQMLYLVLYLIILSILSHSTFQWTHYHDIYYFFLLNLYMQCQWSCFFAICFFESCLFKDGLSLKILFLHIHLYFIAKQYFCNYAHVEDIDNWTRSYILIIWNHQKGLVLKDF